MIGAAASPEFRLTAACCRWPVSGAAIRAAAESKIDWPYFLRVVRRQRVAGLVHNALTASGLELPPQIRSELSAQAHQIARQNLAQTTETVRLQSVFDAAGIPNIVLKGMPLAQLAYGSPALKHTRDIDILIFPGGAMAVFDLLEREGYMLVEPARNMNGAQRRAVVDYGTEAELLRRADNLSVELRWRLAGNELLLKGVDANSPTQRVMLLGAGSIRTLAEDDLFAYLCVHGAGHRWSRLKWLADLNALISARTERDIVRLYRHAQACGAGLCAAQALLLCHRLLGLSVPADLASEFQASRRTAKLVAVALDAMVGSDAAVELDDGLVNMMRYICSQFLLGQSWGYFFAQCRFFSFGVADAVTLPLPRSLRFLYLILRLPLWIWRRVDWAVAGPDERKPRTPLPSAADRPVDRG